MRGWLDANISRQGVPYTDQATGSTPRTAVHMRLRHRVPNVIPVRPKVAVYIFFHQRTASQIQHPLGKVSNMVRTSRIYRTIIPKSNVAHVHVVTPNSRSQGLDVEAPIKLAVPGVQPEIFKVVFADGQHCASRETSYGAILPKVIQMKTIKAERCSIFYATYRRLQSTRVMFSGIDRLFRNS